MTYAYEAPQITELGSVDDLTSGDPTGGNDGAKGGSTPPKTQTGDG